MRRHILVISQYFYPEQFRVNDICIEWVKRGYEVTVITGIPNYPGGRFYDGYGLFKKRNEQYHDVTVIRLPIIPRGRHTVMLVLNYVSFVITGGIWSLFTKIKADKVFIFEVSPMTQALPGVWYAKRRKIPCLLYVQDLWPDNVEIITGIHNRHILGSLNTMVQYIYRNCKQIFVTSESFRKELIHRNVPKSNVIFWPQYAESYYKPTAQIHKAQNLTIVFAGNIGFAQGLEILPKTAALLKDEQIQFLLVGDGRYKERLLEKIEYYGVSCQFEIIGRVKPEQVPQYLSRADAAFISFMDTPLFEKTIPAKLQSYMACGMPIVASVAGETKRIIEEAKCGFCSSLGSAEDLAHIIRRMKLADREIMKKNSLTYYKKYFDKNKLLELMDYYLKE